MSCNSTIEVQNVSSHSEFKIVAEQYWRGQIGEDSPGLVAVFFGPDDESHTIALGMADIESHKPMSADTVFQAASISKVIAAMGVLSLTEENHINLSEPIEDYLSPFEFLPSKWDIKEV